MTEPGFHSVRASGATGRMVVTIEMQDVTTDPRFLGEAPVLDPDGCCFHCGKYAHHLDGVDVSARAFHRFELSPAGGYFADELKEFQS